MITLQVKGGPALQAEMQNLIIRMFKAEEQACFEVVCPPGEAAGFKRCPVRNFIASGSKIEIKASA